MHRTTEGLVPFSVQQGDILTHKFLIKHVVHHKGPYVTDAFFPAEINGSVDLMGIDEGTAAMLNGFIRALRPSLILETGTHRGRSTRAIAEACFLNQIGHVYTVDMTDYGLFTHGAIREHEKPYVTQIIGHTPEVFEQEPLAALSGIDFAYIDGDHTREGLIADLEYVDSHRAPECIILVDNARDEGWPQVEEYFRHYARYSHLCLPNMCGMEVIVMTDGYPRDTGIYTGSVGSLAIDGKICAQYGHWYTTDTDMAEGQEKCRFCLMSKVKEGE